RHGAMIGLVDLSDDWLWRPRRSKQRHYLLGHQAFTPPSMAVDISGATRMWFGLVIANKRSLPLRWNSRTWLVIAGTMIGIWAPMASAIAGQRRGKRRAADRSDRSRI